MSITSRMFSLIESELNKSIEFTFTIVGNPVQRGAGQIRLPRQFTFAVWVRNSSSVAMRDVRGAIAPSSSARFANQSFRVEHLAPREHRIVARVQATLNDTHGDAKTLDRIAAVSVVAHAALNEVRFQDTYRPISFVHPTAEAPIPVAARASRPAARVEPTPGAEPRRIPVSKPKPGWRPTMIPALNDS